MTAKRFRLYQSEDLSEEYVCDNGKALRTDEEVELLNALHEENEQLKQSYKEFEDECQSTFNAMSRNQDVLYRKNFKLKEENEQLKKEVESKERLIKAYDQWAYDLKNDGVLDE